MIKFISMILTLQVPLFLLVAGCNSSSTGKTKKYSTKVFTDGYDIAHYKNGGKKLESRWENGKIKSATSYAPNGKVTGKVTDGSGKLVTYFDDGKKDIEAKCKDGVILRMTFWYREEGKSFEMAMQSKEKDDNSFLYTYECREWFRSGELRRSWIIKYNPEKNNLYDLIVILKEKKKTPEPIIQL